MHAARAEHNSSLFTRETTARSLYHIRVCSPATLAHARRTPYARVRMLRSPMSRRAFVLALSLACLSERAHA